MTELTARASVVPSYPTGSVFLVSVEVCLWSLYTIGVIMLLVVTMMQ